MAKLPTKRDLSPVAGPAPTSAPGFRVQTPNVRPGQLSTINVDMMGQEVIPRMPQANFGAERRRIAALREEAATQDYGLNQFGKEMLRIKASINAEKAKQDDLASVKAESERTIALSDAEVKALELPSREQPGYMSNALKEINEDYVSKLPVEQQERGRYAVEADSAVKMKRYHKNAIAQDRIEQVADAEIRLENQAGQLAMETDPLKIQELSMNQYAEIDALVRNEYISPQRGEQLKDQYIKAPVAVVAQALEDKEPLRLLEEIDGFSAAEGFLLEKESNGRFHIMEDHGLGYAGGYQFGSERLKETGFYTPKKGEKLNSWGGVFKIINPETGELEEFQDDPSTPDNEGLQAFLASKVTQKAAFKVHAEMALDEFKKDGTYDKYIGKERFGVLVTEQALIAMRHIAGGGGTRTFLATGKMKRDVNGTTARIYGRGANRYGFFNKNLTWRKKVEIKDRIEGYAQTALNNMFTAAQNGQELDIATVEKVEGLVNYFKDPKMTATLNSVKDLKSYVQEVKALPFDKMQDAVSEAQAAVGTSADVFLNAKLKAARSVLTQAQTSLKDDMLSFEEENNPNFTVTKIDLLNVSEDELQKRISNAVGVAKKHKQSMPTYTTKPERTQIKDQFAKANTDQRFQMLTTMAKNLGSNSELFLRELGDDFLIPRHLVFMLNANGDSASGAVLAALRGFDKISGDETNQFLPKAEFRRNAILPLESAFPQGYGHLTNRIRETADAIYTGMGAFEPDSDDAKKAYAQAVSMALGESTNAVGETTGGLGEVGDTPVILPSHMTEDQFEDTYYSLDDTHIATFSKGGGAPAYRNSKGRMVAITADSMRDNGYLVSVGPGEYWITMEKPGPGAPPKPLFDMNTGLPYILDLSLAAPMKSGGAARRKMKKNDPFIEGGQAIGLSGVGDAFR